MSELTKNKSILYKKNFLSEVIIRVDLVSPIPSLAIELPKSIGKKALDIFPIDEPIKGFTQLGESEKELTKNKMEFIEWNFFGRNREKQLNISQDHFFITNKNYLNFGSFKNEFIKIAEVIFNEFNQAQPSRLGLRYINQIGFQEENALEWNDYIDTSLLGLMSFSIKESKPTRIFHNFEVLNNQGFNLKFQFGIFNSDYPAPIRKKDFILDYDAFYKGLIEPKDISNNLDLYHYAIQELFESNITDKLRKVMNE